MNIINENETGTVQQLSIEVSKVDYAETVETALKKYRKTAQIPGFRIGNAPMGLIKRTYEKPLIADEVNKIVGECLNDYFKNNNINIIFEPMLVEEKSTIDFEKKEDFVFTFEFALQPEFEINFAELPLMKSFKIEAAKNEIEDFMNQIRKRHGDYINPEAIEDDDYVTVKWGDNENGVFFVKDLTEKGKDLFLGKKKDDLVTVNFNELFTSKENLKKFLKNESDNFDEAFVAEAEVNIFSIGRVNLAEMNDEFFQKAFPDNSITTVADFETHASQQIELQWKQETDRKFMNDAISLLLQNIEMDLPENFIKNYILKNNTEVTEEKLTQEWKQYQDSLKWQLIESKLGKDGNIEVTIDDVKTHIRDFYYQNYFMQFNLADVQERLNQLVEEAVKDQKQVKQLYDQLFDQRIMELLQSKMNVEELSGDFSQFVAFISGKEAPSEKKKAEAKKTRRSPAKKKEN